MNFYTNCVCLGKKILYRGWEDGERICREMPYAPSLFLPSPKESKYKTLDGKFAERINFANVGEAKDFIKEYGEVENFKFYGNTNFQYAYLADQFPQEHLDYDLKKISVVNIDIEVSSENGFPHPDLASAPVISIAFKAGGINRVYGLKPYAGNLPIKYIYCQDEQTLLQMFIADWKKINPDAVTGWNISTFDIPYLINRITKLFGAKAPRALSPWGWISERRILILGREHILKEIYGVSQLDYLDMYKKFSPNRQQENYKLGTIAEVELGETKTEYDGTLHDLYTKDFDKFLEYNANDVELVDKLDKKLQLLSLVIGMAYDAKVNYGDVFSQVRMWDTIIYNHLKKRNIVLPQKKIHIKSEKYAGAFVKLPQTGLHKWVVSYDLNSLYPHIIAQWNISPDAFKPEMFREVTIEELLDNKTDLEYCKTENVTFTANGHHFTREFQGFLPEILMKMYKDRKQYKKEMLVAKGLLEKVETEIAKRGIS